MHHQTFLFSHQWIRNDLSNKRRAPLKTHESEVKGHIAQTHKGDNVGVWGVLRLTAKGHPGSKTRGMLSELKVRTDERMRGCGVSWSEGLWDR